MYSNYDIFRDEFEDDEFATPHLPLDWNEDLSLEEYLERMEKRSKSVNDLLDQ
jgi:hypothetical protein